MAMASVGKEVTHVLRGTIIVVLFLHSFLHSHLQHAHGGFQAQQWVDGAHATFYGGSDASGTMGGACGYGNLYSQGYGVATAALSTVLFNSGLTCGACYEIKCKDSTGCLSGDPSTTVTATNLCPPNYAKPNDDGGWCNPPLSHFDMSVPAFLKIATYVTGIVPVLYRRIPCHTNGGVRFTITGNPYFNLILISNVGGAGDVHRAMVKSSKSGWTQMWQNWGQNWQFDTDVVGQSLSIQIQTDDNQVLVSENVADGNWQFGQTFEGASFH